MKIALKIALILTLTFLSADALVENTKHNLSTSGPGTTKAQTEDQICVFCHIPHLAQQGAPLWNREMPASNYTMYDSTYLRRTGYPVPADLGSTTGTPGAKSRVCLSCHDGTVAVGAVYILRGTILGDTIAMSGVEGIGTIPVASSTNFSTDLSNHHPVGYEYDASAGTPKAFGAGGSTTTELKATPTAPLKLYTYADTKDYVECTSCHDPHTENAMFLRVSSGASHGENVLNTCLACHDKDGWTGSVHQTGTGVYADAAVMATYGVNTIAGLGCINCHAAHNGGGKPSLLRKVEQNTCYQGAAGTGTETACHGTGGAKDIETMASNTYKHPINTIDGVHTTLDTLYGVGNLEGDAEVGKGVDWDNSRHAECADCHNPHKAQAGNHVTASGGLASDYYPVMGTNLVSPALSGVSGVEPNWAPVWQQTTSFTTMKEATKEYQICLKCHSYWGVGSASFGRSSFNLTEEGGIITDQAWEFNPNNRAAHPVTMSLRQMRVRGGGSRTAYRLFTDWLKPPWNANAGDNVMYCTDCHGNQDETVDPKGPHGSDKKYLLKGEKMYWPLDPGGQPWTILDVLDTNVIPVSPEPEVFCLNCHSIEANSASYPGNGAHRIKSDYGDSFGFPAGGVKCTSCHVVVPHGAPNSRLIGYYNFPEPYNLNGNSLQLTGFRSNYSSEDNPVYSWGDAYLVDHNGSVPGYPAIDTVPSCGPNGSAFCHGSSGGGYDPFIPFIP